MAYRARVVMNRWMLIAVSMPVMIVLFLQSDLCLGVGDRCDFIRWMDGCCFASYTLYMIM